MGFVGHEDLQKMVAAKLAALLADEVRVSPLVLDGGSREEKTAFIRDFIAFLKTRKAPFHCVYVDVGESADNMLAMMSFVSDLVTDLPENEKERFFHAAEALMRLATDDARILNSYLKRKSPESLMQSLPDSDTESQLRQHLEAQRNIRVIRDILDRHTQNNPALVFVDGLESADPDFVVRILKAIHIVFRIPNLQFVLLVDVGYLASAVSRFFGPSVDEQAWLQQNIGFRFKFGRPDDLLTEPA